MLLKSRAGTVPIVVASMKQEEAKQGDKRVQKEKLFPSNEAFQVEARNSASKPPPKTRGAFRKGALLSMLLVIPGLSQLLSHRAELPLATGMTFDEIFATVAIFAGLPALLVFGGVGKNLARQANRSRRSLLTRGSLLGALAGISLALLASIPTATLPTSISTSVIGILWAALLGGTTGALLGLWIDHARRRETRAGPKDEA